MENIEKLQEQLQELSESIQKDIEAEIDIDTQVNEPIRKSIEIEIRKLIEVIEKHRETTKKEFTKTFEKLFGELSSNEVSIRKNIGALDLRLEENRKDLLAEIKNLAKDQSDYFKRNEKTYESFFETAQHDLCEQSALLSDLRQSAEFSQNDLVEKLQSAQLELGMQGKKITLQFWGTVGTLLVVLVILFVQIFLPT